MSDLITFTIEEALAGLNNQDFTAEELTKAHLSQIETHNAALNAFVVDTADKAIEQAKASDTRRAQGNAKLIDGIPVGVKDLFCTKDYSSTSCSKILEGFTPTYESTVTTKLFDEGGVMIGKTNMNEFAMGSANKTSVYGPCINPWKRNNDDADIVPGGSSGGSAAAVSAFMCMAALGSDTGGSVRQPAAFCGNVGVKPTYGRCSRFGMIAFASSLDQAGVFARTVRDSALVLQSICGHDPHDSTSSNNDVPAFYENINSSLKGKKIGIPKEYRQDNMPEEIESWWHKGAKWLEEQGAEIIDIELPHTKYALPAYYIIAPAEASSNLARYDGVRYGMRISSEGSSLDDMYELTRAEGFGDEVKRRIMIGTYVLSAGFYDAYYKKAQRVRTLIARDFAKSFEHVDAILTPATPSAAFGVNEKMDSLTTYLNDIFTVPASLAGLPGIAVPVGLSNDGLPLGLQIIGKAFDEQTVFDVAAALEESASFTHTPGGF